MTASNKVAQSAPKDSAKEGFDIVRLLLEGRAFFALIVIVIVFSLLSPVYFTTAKLSGHVVARGDFRFAGGWHVDGGSDRRD